jgi:hypothetical protein
MKGVPRNKNPYQGIYTHENKNSYPGIHTKEFKPRLKNSYQCEKFIQTEVKKFMPI